MPDELTTVSDVLDYARQGDAVALQAAVNDVIQSKADDILSARYDEIEQDLLGDAVEDEIEAADDEVEVEDEEVEDEEVIIDDEVTDDTE